MKTYPHAGVTADMIRRENINVRVGGQMAWATFEQIAPQRALADEIARIPGLHHHMRVLEKHDGRWLIAALVEVQTRLGYYESPWVRIDEKTRVLDMNGAARSALPDHPALMVTAGRLCGRSSADNTCLRDTIEQAVSRPIGPDKCGPFPMVFADTEDGTLSLCWLRTDDQMLLVLFHDRHMTRRTIAHAASIFGLTRAQQRVAEQVAAGHDLPQTARTLGVSASTVRTHVKRMFEKVGVSSQAALMRALLSVEPPAV
jgi:DNA-binding CsgD family transcriptional regulator